MGGGVAEAEVGRKPVGPVALLGRDRDEEDPEQEEQKEEIDWRGRFLEFGAAKMVKRGLGAGHSPLSCCGGVVVRDSNEESAEQTSCCD